MATTLVFGIGGMSVGSGGFSMQGVSLCTIVAIVAIVAIVLNLVLPQHKTPAEGLHEEQEVVDDLIDHAR